MNKNSCGILGSHKRSLSKWRVCYAPLLIAAILMGMIPTVHAAGNDTAIPELPSIEVRGQSQKLDFSMPVIIEAKVPRLRANLRGVEVRMVFSVDKGGEIFAIGHNTPSFDSHESQVAVAMAQQLKYWKFKPAVDKHGNAKSVRMALPVKIVAPGKGNVGKYANIAMSDPVLLAVLDR